MKPDAFVGKPMDLVMTRGRLARLRSQIRGCILCGRSKVVFVGVLVPGNAEMAEAVALGQDEPDPGDRGPVLGREDVRGRGAGAVLRRERAEGAVTFFQFLRSTFPEFMADSWRPWRCVLALVFGEAPEDPALASELSGLAPEDFPTRQVRRAGWVVARRAGKSRIAALVAVYMLAIKKYPRLAPGERAIFVVTAGVKGQGQSIKSYVLGLMRQVPELSALIESVTHESITLSNGLALQVLAGRDSIRGATILGAVIDESSFIRTAEDNAFMSDQDIVNAIEPGMLSIPDPLLLVISSPGRKKGFLYRMWARVWGKKVDGNLVVKAPTLTMNPSADKARIEDAYRDDPVAAATELGGEWRDDVSEFVSAEKLDAATDAGVQERPRIEGVTYRAFADPAGGTGGDSFVVAIAHEENGVQVLDVVAGEEPPFSPAQVIKACAVLLKSYGVYAVTTDRYSGGFAPEQWRLNGIEWRPSEKSRSELYLAFVPMLNSGGCRLVDEEKVRAQFLALRRKVAPGGRESVDHPIGGSDDYCNAAAGALVMNAGARYRVRSLAS